MQRLEIDIGNLVSHPLRLFDRQWALLAAGNLENGDYNCMTISWGSMGTMWNKPFVQVVVRPTRHTFSFMEKFDSFTISVFPEEHRKALELLGTKSGRDGDKIAESGLTPEAALKVAAPCFREAELVLSCRKIYQDDFLPENFLDAAINRHYQRRDYHRIYFGEVLAVEGTAIYHAGQIRRSI